MGSQRIRTANVHVSFAVALLADAPEAAKTMVLKAIEERLLDMAGSLSEDPLIPNEDDDRTFTDGPVRTSIENHPGYDHAVKVLKLKIPVNIDRVIARDKNYTHKLVERAFDAAATRLDTERPALVEAWMIADKPQRNVVDISEL